MRQEDVCVADQKCSSKKKTLEVARARNGKGREIYAMKLETDLSRHVEHLITQHCKAWHAWHHINI